MNDKQEISAKLDAVDALYPKERVERSKQRFLDIWSGRFPSDRYPFAMAPTLFNVYDDCHTPEERVTATLDDLIVRGIYTDDTVPSVFPGCLQTTLPNMLGAPVIGAGSASVCERIVKRYEDVDALTLSMAPGTVAYGWLESEKRILDLTDGRIPVHICDMQGPFDAAAQLCGYDMLILMAYDDEERYSRLMRLMNEAFCSFWEAQLSLIGDNCIPTHLFGWDYMPPIPCAAMSIDSLAMLSPAFLEEYVIPYMKEISARLGKLVVHSCGNFGHNIRTLMDEDIIIGINASQMTVRQMTEKGLTRDKVVITASGAETIIRTLTMCKEQHLFASLSVWGPRPTGVIPGRTEKTARTWTEEEKAAALAVNRRLLEAAEMK